MTSIQGSYIGDLEKLVVVQKVQGNLSVVIGSSNFVKEVVSQELVSSAITVNPVDFYQGDKPSLEYIAADADIERDVFKDVYGKVCASAPGVQLHCIVGEPGSGKSTLMLRIGYELARDGNRVFRIMATAHESGLWSWYVMEKLSSIAKKPFYVLVDDIFRDKNVIEELDELNKVLRSNGSSMTIIATSRLSEYPLRMRAKIHIERIELGKVSDTEKRRALQKVGIDENSLSREERTKLEKADRMLVLMIVLARGPPLKDIEFILDKALERVGDPKEGDPIVYEAYKYICFVHQYDLATPLTLIENFPQFRGVWKRKGAHGLIDKKDYFPMVKQPRRESLYPVLLSYHSLLAEMTWKLYKEREPNINPKAILIDLLKFADVSNIQESLFITHLFRSSLEDGETQLCHQVLTESCQKVIDLQEGVIGVDHLTIWKRIYEGLDMQEDASRCLELAKRKNPVNSPDCVVKMTLLADEQAFAVAEKWLTQYPDDVHVRTLYLHRLRKGTDEQVEQALMETGQWLSEDPTCPGHVDVRVAHLDLIKERMPGKLTEALNGTADWLDSHTEYPGVIEKCLCLIKEKGFSKQVLDYSKKWLAAPENQEHRGYAHVGTAYLKLLADKKKGDKELLRCALDEIADWLSQHDEDVYLRASYFTTVREGTTTQYQRAIDEGFQWISDPKHPASALVVSAYLRLIKRKGTEAQIERAITWAKSWLDSYPENPGYGNVRVPFNELIRVHRPKEFKRALKETLSWASGHTNHSGYRFVMNYCAKYLKMANFA